MNNSKLQQVFSRIILNSLNDNKKGLYKEANFLRSLWDFVRAFRGVFGLRRGLRDAQSAFTQGNPLNEQQLKALSENLGRVKEYLPNAQKIENFTVSARNYPNNIVLPGGTTPNLAEQIPDLLRDVSIWQLMKANPFKTVALGVPTVGAAGALATGGYYGTRHLLRNFLGTDPATVRETIQQGISEGLQRGLQDTRLVGGGKGTQQLQQPPKAIPSTAPNTASAEELSKLLTSYLLRSNKTASDVSTNNITRNLGNLSPNIKKKSFFSKSAEGNQNKSILETVGSLMDPLVSLTGKDPNSVSNISKLLLLSGLTAGTASLFKRKNKWLPWLGGGLVLSGLGSSFFLDPRSQQEGQNTTVTAVGSDSGSGNSSNQQQQQ